MDAKLVRVDREDHPDRCQSTTSFGQCTFQVVEGCPYCPAHGGVAAGKALEKKDVNAYRIGKYQARMQELGNGKSLGLRDELGVARMLLETKLNAWQEPNELICNSGAIIQILGTIQKLVIDIKKLESSLGMLLDQQAIRQLCNGLLAIMERFLDPDDMAQVAELIVAEISIAAKTKVEIDA